jgi:protein tyrosine phosphatase (PTP) superfamily phosphohydrolase (DUF442 family)
MLGRGMQFTWNILLLIGFAAGLAAAEQTKKSAPGAKPLPDPPGVHNLYLLGTNVYSGSTPEGEEGYEALARLGVKTIISVDGAKPDVELAKKHGMRYVHLPHGYDGISTNLQTQLAKAGMELPGPLYVHCHHGKHRGPAAAAIVCMTKESWEASQAEQWLKAAGTSTNYAGLYETVQEFKKPTAAELRQTPSHFPEVAKVSGLVEAMVSIDERWEHLKAVRAANYGPPPSHPDIQPANEAVILWENYRESQRLPDSIQLGDDFIARLKTAEAQVKEAESLLRQFAAKPSADIRVKLDGSFDAMGKSCASCHKAYRDTK